MYSGSTLTNISGNVLGAHQKLNRSARKSLKPLLVDDSHFPNIKMLLHFEGKNGPDGIKSKSTGRDEPWHFFDPFDPDDGNLIEIIEEHYENLVAELKNKNEVRSAFEASWLAHALVDGLTPAHHYPFEEKLEKLRGEAKESRTSIKSKIIIPGSTMRESIAKNWQMWGAKGLFTTHALFEGGAAMIMAPMTHTIGQPSRYDIKSVHHIGLPEYFKRVAREVALLDMYEQFYKSGWTPKLAKVVRKELAPHMARTITVAWYMAAHDAGLTTGEI